MGDDMGYPLIVQQIAHHTGESRENSMVFWDGLSAELKLDMTEYFRGIRNDRCDQLVKNIKARQNK